MRKRVIIIVAVGVTLVGAATVYALVARNTSEVAVTRVGNPVPLGVLGADDTSSDLDTDRSPTPQPLAVNSLNPTGTSLNMNDQTLNSGNNSPADFTQFEQYKKNESALFQDVTVGTGNEATAGKKLTMDYRGWLTNGQVFDESYARGQAFQFVLGSGQVIAGWDQGVAGMKVGGKRRLVVPPSVGYGDRAVGSIPAGSVLVFDVELREVN